jgi:hypothetical protein
MIVNMQLQKISSVPRESGDDTKFVLAVGMVHVVSSLEYACEFTAKASMIRLRPIILNRED